jgi:hypothetical protein
MKVYNHYHQFQSFIVSPHLSMCGFSFPSIHYNFWHLTSKHQRQQISLPDLNINISFLLHTTTFCSKAKVKNTPHLSTICIHYSWVDKAKDQYSLETNYSNSSLCPTSKECVPAMLLYYHNSLQGFTLHHIRKKTQQ